jgi:hypothetical protein
MVHVGILIHDLVFAWRVPSEQSYNSHEIPLLSSPQTYSDPGSLTKEGNSTCVVVSPRVCCSSLYVRRPSHI